MIITKSTISIAPEDPDVDSPYFIKPSGFRPNSLFVGREAELEQMHKMLFDKKRRADGTSAVLLQSMPGGGKTHLARQYVYDHKDDFPGGIFWLRAKSDTELAAGFWDIARKVALKHLVGTEEAASLDDPEFFISKVRTWLENRHDWLLVLDGMQFNDETMRKFIPDSTNSCIIYTSTEKSVIGDHHYMNPQIIKLPQLSAREAQSLLLLELGRTEPFAKDDLKYSMELVQSMGFLPVVIHAVVQRLKATDEPLSKFARTYSSEPKLRGLGTYIAVVDQLKSLGAKEGLNLIQLLCFFSQHIPVEMISLGIKGLDVPVKAFETVSGHSLNNTFKILNTFALIDRNEPEPALHSSQSQSSKGSRDMLADNVDVIRLHSVVQGFFLDTLHADGTLLVWLDRAIRVFCCSYDMANERISRKAHAGLVEDYRLYEIHGIKIKDHLTKHLSKHLTRDQKEILEESEELLNSRLRLIKAEIDRRTPESSTVIAEGKSENFQCSIFDRASSSSDTGPETPGKFDGLRSGISTWGIEADKDQHESPASLTHDTDYQRRMAIAISDAVSLSMPEDPGYDSDREGSTAMTAQPSQRTVLPDRSTSSDEPWREVRSRKPRRSSPSPLHRTIKNLEKSRYRDTAGAYRALSAIDPRVSRDTAQGYFQGTPFRTPSRGRAISGASRAEVSLANISQHSPPPARGGGMIQDRRSSSLKPVDRGRMMSGLASYAAAVSGPTRDTISGLRELINPTTDAMASSSESGTTRERPRSSAMDSLQKIEHHTPVPMPPYPQSPPVASSSKPQYFQPDSSYQQENMSSGPDPFPTNVYPRMEGLPPVESRISAPPSPRSFEHVSLHREVQSESMPASLLLSRSNASDANILSLSYPNIQQPNYTSSSASAYYPGLPEFSNQEGGYTSQPMTRDPSGQTDHSTGSIDAGLHEGRRRPSAAETEPEPRLPTFSPRIAPTSYQVYERMREKDLLRASVKMDDEGMGERQLRLLGRGAREREMKRSPRLEFARAALIERLDDWEKGSDA